MEAKQIRSDFTTDPGGVSATRNGHPMGGDPAHTAGEGSGHGSHQAAEGGMIKDHWISGEGLTAIHLDTVLYAAIVMALLLTVFGLLARTVNPVPQENSGPTGAVLESVVEFCANVVNEFIGNNIRPYLWYIGSVFVFVLTCNWLALLPWAAWEMAAGAPLSKALGLHHALVYEAPTADLNMTLAMAFITLALYWYFGIKQNGVEGFLGHHWFDSPWQLFPLRMLEDITRPASLALRLFANMTAGHIMGMVLLMLTYFIVPAILLPLELFVGAVQAFVFAVLSASYIGTAAADHSHSHSH